MKDLKLFQKFKVISKIESYIKNLKLHQKLKVISKI